MIPQRRAIVPFGQIQTGDFALITLKTIGDDPEFLMH
jgi:hypothetical protein